jgi:ribosome-binding protein aMBF1 (putative translation factor)
MEGWSIVERKKRKPARESISDEDVEIFTKGVAPKAADRTSFLLISREFSTALQKARQNNKLTRAQLAYMINEKEHTVESYENENGVASIAVINKINKLLNVTLPKLNKHVVMMDEN